MAKGTPFRRCGCKDPQTGKQFGRRCPRLSNKAHGSWWYRYEAPATPSGSRRQPLIGPFRTQKAANESLTDVLARLGRNEHVETDRQLTVAAYLDEWIISKINLTVSTRASYREHIDLYFKPALGHLRLVDLRDKHIEALYAIMRRLGTELGDCRDPVEREILRRVQGARKAPTRPLSAARIRRIHATLRSALNSAVRRKKISHSPAEHVELASTRYRKPLVWTDQRVNYWRRTGRRPSPVMVWTPAQAAEFLDLDLVKNDDLYPLWRLIAYRGIRRAEAAGLPDYDVDLNTGNIDIRETLAHVTHHIDQADERYDDPKSEAGARSTSLDAGTIAVLSAYRRQQAERRHILGTAWIDSGRFFTKPNGAPLSPAWLSQRFRYLIERAGSRWTPCTAITNKGRSCERRIAGDIRCHQHGGAYRPPPRDGLPPIRLHDLRHGSATYALAAGIATKVVSEDLGHARVQTTENLYVSVLPELKQASADAVADTITRARQR